ncbi:Penicillin amidase family protein [Roseovarius sp. EC-HK134]|uniref:penicillin acylase family protein n=1 Tax=unclassified Roseovarius TaxID=2614913 RepID=UPI00015567D4|nr:MULTISPECIES: penicillin acylase family protein [unclassified Roseovarius]AWZ22219.1 Penicillin amidase family protein [Roseovarius sp. AK1035]EDM30492.1 penicillin amidase family protein [Roseovarius sp. TM1035]VVT26174.1 Penicillin amidase family protein [Roseovarius sp. EC-HK134]VVT26348.1 Penicillin amidase family protein [Roseovarius sp. EC-SD190]
MSGLVKWLLRLAGGAILLAVLALLGAYFLLSRSLPDYDKTLSVPGITAPVEIVRDNANVPHILGQTDADSFFGLGYAHAQDRLWQMMTMRRTVQGRLSEVFGTRTVKIDSTMRRFDLYTLARQSVTVQDAETLAALKAYSDGVNARLNEINREALGRGAPEQFIFNAPIAPWQPADSIALIKLMAVQLSSHLENEVLFARAALALENPNRLADIMPLAPGSGIAALPEYAALFPGANWSRIAQTSPERGDPLSPFKRRAFAGASNAFAAAPSRSASGGTLLANDPHLGFSAPNIWYLARLNLTSGGVIGGTIPGIPAILTGRSARLGWAVTSSYLDDQDLYIEELNPDDPNQYRTPDGWKPFRTTRSIVEIKDADPVTLTLRWTENGPVLPGSHYNLAEVTPAGHVAALNWTALSPEDTTMSSAIGLMRAQSVQDAIDLSRLYIAPSQNLTLVDQSTIAMRTIGAMPRRDARHESEGRMPARGWLPENRWQGTLPFAANPEFVAPSGGILGNTNNKVVDRPFPMHVSHLWGDTQRVHRWRRLMQGREVHTRESFIEAQLDTVSFTARSLLPLIGADLWFTGESAPEGTPERLRQRALTMLADWNGEMNEHLPEPLLYAAWMRALMDRLIRDDLGPLSREFDHPDPIFIERVFRNVDGAADWCDVKQSAAIETCTDTARMALDDALIWISERYGQSLESLRWGDAHQATHDHQVLGDVPLLRHFVNIRQSTSGGDNTLLRGRTRGGNGPDPFHNVHGAGYRGVYDFADPDSSVFIIATGQSGHFLSRYYDNLSQLWRRGEYIPMSLDPDLARAASVGITTLLPTDQ